MPNLEIDITINEQRWKNAINNIEQFTYSTVNKVFYELPSSIENAEISIVLANDHFVQELNKNYRGKDKSTNVLSFPQTEKLDFETDITFCSLGDVIISLETIEHEAHEQSKSIKDHYAHMLVHGCLHLLHLDHQNENEAEIMELREIDILKGLGIKNPYEIR